MSEHLIFVGTYAIPEGSFDVFNAANQDMGAFVQAHEPRMISWHTYVNDEHTEATTIMVHPDSASLEYHLQVAGSRVRAGTQMVRTKRIELYGKASEALLTQLRRLSELSGAWPILVKPHLHGYPEWGQEGGPEGPARSAR